MSTSQGVHVAAQPIEILLVEDDDDDVRLTRKAFEKDRILNRLHRAEDGVDAMNFLRRQGEHANAIRPDLIFLDLNMPRKSGREVLTEIRQDPDLADIPVVILTTSDDERDVAFSQENAACGFLTKPIDLNKLRDVLASVNDFWFSVVRL